MSAVNINQAKTNLSRLIAEVEAGGDVTISRGVIPVARLVAIERDRQPQKNPNRVPGVFAHLGPIQEDFFDPLPEEDVMVWEGGANPQAPRSKEAC